MVDKYTVFKRNIINIGIRPMYETDWKEVKDFPSKVAAMFYINEQRALLGAKAPLFTIRLPPL